MATTALFTDWKTTSGEGLGDLGLLSPDSPLTRTWPQVVDDLLAVRGLVDDWDGQGADAPSPAVVDAAIALAHHLRANRLRPADRAIAGVNGTICLEWHDAAGYLELEVTAPDRAEGRWVAKGSSVARTVILSRRQ